MFKIRQNSGVTSGEWGRTARVTLSSGDAQMKLFLWLNLERMPVITLHKATTKKCRQFVLGKIGETVSCRLG